MTDTALLPALIGGFAVIIAALIGLVARVSVVVSRVQKDTAVSREHLANDHVDAEGKPINFRVDMDHMREEMRTGFRDIKDGQKRVDAEIGGIRSELRDIRRDQRKLRDDIDDTKSRQN